MRKSVRNLAIFPGDYPRRTNVILEVLRNEPSAVLLKELEGRDRSENTKRKLTSCLGYNFMSASTYLEGLLVPSALVDKIELGLEASGTTYALTRSGQRYGAPMAEFTLKYSSENDIWLGDFLGRGTGERSIKACGRRYQILKTLYESDRPLSKLTLSLAGFTSFQTVTNDIAKLVSQELVSSECLETDYFGFRYLKWAGKVENLQGSQNKYARILADFLKRNKKVTLSEIKTQTEIPPHQIMDAVIKLGEANLTIEIDRFKITKKYEIEMTEKGKKLWETYFKPLREFLSDRTTLPRSGNIEEVFENKRRALEIFVERANN